MGNSGLLPVIKNAFDFSCHPSFENLKGLLLEVLNSSNYIAMFI
jgi:hypothetical protein